MNAIASAARYVRRHLLMLVAGGCLIGSPYFSLAQDHARPRSRESTPSLPLPSRTSTTSDVGHGKSFSSANSLLSTTISLGLIVGTIILVGRWMKRNGFQGTRSLPLEAFELLGRRQIEPRVAVHLVRCGNRILILGVGAEGVRTLSEIEDPAEVQRLTSTCQGTATVDNVVVEPDPKRTTPATPLSTLARRGLAALVGLSLLFAVEAAYAQSARGQTGVRSKDLADGPRPARQRAVQQAAFDEPVPRVEAKPAADRADVDSQALISPQQMELSLKMIALMTVFSLAPSILMMTTCYVRFIVVLGLLRQALGSQQGPPNQVLAAICMMLTLLVMSPVWQRSYREGIQPYTSPEAGQRPLDESTALARTLAPVRTFMSLQIDKAGNADAVWMLLDFQRPADDASQSRDWNEPQSYDDVPFTVLAPAYLLSELKVAFLIGFQLFLPFLVIDLVVATVLTSLGLTMMPPSMVSLPFKLLLFVLIDGWFLTVGMLLESVRVV